MPRATLAIAVPSDAWIGELSRDHPDARIRVLAAVGDDDEGTAIAIVEADDPAPILAEMESREAVSEVDLLQRGGEEIVVQFSTSDHLLLESARGSGVPLEMPVEIADGRATIEVTGPQDRLSMLADQFETAGIEYSVERLRQEISPSSLLTDRQRHLVREAVAAGYYDVPRDCTLTELADRVDLAKSTVSETLHRAESAVLKEYVGRLAPAEGSITTADAE
ncbi:MAG: helix-turn-helix domain-containing protein [Halococcoides sp.]